MALALPPFLVTNCWLHFLGLAGVWRGWLPLNIVSLGGTVWILSLLTWPITLLMVLSAWQRLEPSQLESDVAVQRLVADSRPALAAGTNGPGPGGGADVRAGPEQLRRARHPASEGLPGGNVGALQHHLRHRSARSS